MYLITDRDVYEINCREVGEDLGRIGHRFRVTIKDEDGETLRRIDVGFTSSLLATTSISDQDKCNYAMKKAAQAFKIGSNASETSISTGNFERLRGKKADTDIIHGELKALIHRFFTKHPETVLHRLSPGDLFISSDLDFWKIVNSLPYFKTRGIIKETSDNEDEYILAPGGLDKLDTLEPPTDAGITTVNRYFQLVSLPRGIKKPFVFVLMPFKDKGEFEQKVYREVIKPTVEQELGVTCVRSDEVSDPGVINNQIFTLIREARCVIAETTTGNANVFYEVGMAHTFNKDVFIFNRSGRELPFDIASNRAVFYDDNEDLKRKLVENLKDHV
ncbi:MAG: hypothetical protein KAV87_33450 [Desulfobacteraceae bacterium]|nr:hypothetical protein [Desulfobacteraceae bacterium]